MFAVTVQPGDTLSGIASEHGESLATLEGDNPQFSSNWNLIIAGQTVNIGGGGSWTPPSAPQSAPVQHSTPSQTPAVSPSNVPVSDSSGGFHIPGMSDSMASCIAYRESTNDTNPAAHGNAFGIIPASGYNVAGDSLAQQEQVAGQIYAQSGGGAWAADGCPGT
jgi:hypothetical protein